MVDLRAPVAVRRIVDRLATHGHEAWAVGGAVRDAVLDHDGGDWDLATDARPENVRRIFRRTVPLGIEHGTIGVVGADGVLYEVTTFRRDVETTGRHAVVAFADTIDEDLARRDFTINAIAWNPRTGELRDPFGGAEDLRARTLRTVGEPADRFAEDYLRVLRALRFAGHYDLTVDEATWAALREAVPHLHVLSAERVREELWKVLGKTRNASATLRHYAGSGVLEALYPEVAATTIIERNGGTAWDVTLAAVDAIPPHRVLLRVAALLHAVGYPAARTRDLRGGWRYVGHETMGARKADDMMRRLKASNADTERVTDLVAKQTALFPPDAPDAGVRRWLVDVGPDLVRDLFRLRIALHRAAPVPRGEKDLVMRWRKAHAVLLAHPVLGVRGLAVNGHDLQAAGIPAGPGLGRTLALLFQHVLEDPTLNTREQLLELARTGGAET